MHMTCKIAHTAQVIVWVDAKVMQKLRIQEINGIRTMVATCKKQNYNKIFN